jgi:16S rRNA (guanine(966)-N(2))-methyltransferase RsmD
LRVVSGIARNRKLITLPGDEIIRPTAEVVKEAMFSAIQFDIEGAAVIDMFAGCGQLGIEALSRGADYVVFTDNNPQSVRVIHTNLDSLEQYRFNYKISNSPCQMFLKANPDAVFDIAILDPPYGHGMCEKTLPFIADRVSDRGIIICEHERETDLPDSAVGETRVIPKHKVYKYGKKKVTIYRV